LTDEEQQLKKKNISDLARNLKMKDSLTYQQSRVKWLAEGDANSRYFHARVNFRRKKNSITVLKDGDVWVEQVEEIKELVQRHFDGYFKEEFMVRPRVAGIQVG
jgi:hypothetical protein